MTDIGKADPIKPRSVSQKRKPHLFKFRKIAFRAFVPKKGQRQETGIVLSTQIVSQRRILPKHSHHGHWPQTIFKSWRFTSKGNFYQAKSLVAVVRHQISSKSPDEQHPKTWKDYDRLYAMEHIDVNNPPLPPTEPGVDKPSAYEKEYYQPPVAINESICQIVINRLGLFGKASFDSSDAGTSRAKKQIEISKQLEQEGRVPQNLDQAWEHLSTSSDVDITQVSKSDLKNDLNQSQRTLLDLEQHPLLRKIARTCQEMFSVSYCCISVMERDRQVLLADSCLPNLREAPRDTTICAHTVLSGRSGLTVLDTHQDWRFKNGPVSQVMGGRFYCGVPLLAPQFETATKETDETTLIPIGSLCIIDRKPRDEFGVEKREQLVWMAQYIRREIEEWFLNRMQRKIAFLEGVQQDWVRELKRKGGLGMQSLWKQGQTKSTWPALRAASSLALRPYSSGGRIEKNLTASSCSNDRTGTAAPSHQARRQSLFDDLNAQVTPVKQKLFDMATKLISETLELSIVYLLAVGPGETPFHSYCTIILSSHDLPFPTPDFDPGLHLRVLHDSGGGLLYQNPDKKEVEEAGLKMLGSRLVASAILLRVGDEPEEGFGGFVLGGVTRDEHRVFGEEDVVFLKQFAHELAAHVVALKI